MDNEQRCGTCRCLLQKFPTLDLSWPEYVQDKWWAVFWLLLDLPNGKDCPTWHAK